MEHAIVHNDLSKEAIKPQALMTRFLDLTADYNRTRLPMERLEFEGCPACGSRSVASSFPKMNLQYFTCGECRSVYLNPRPAQGALRDYFRESASRRFWLQEIWGRTAGVRRSKILEPFLDWMELFVEPHFQGRSLAVAEIFPVHWGLLEVWRERGWRGTYRLVDPYFTEDLCPIPLEGNCLPFDTAERFDVVCLPDTLAWVRNPATAFEWVAGHLNPGGFCFLTTIFSTGLDVVVLKGLSSYLVPPERLNLFSVSALKETLVRFPLEVLECSTPGVLDARNISEAALRGDVALPENIRPLLEGPEAEGLLESFQEFLQVHRLSSQGRVVLRKKSQ